MQTIDKQRFAFSNAPRKGLEPLTHGLTVRCSNRLSYRGIFSAFFQKRCKVTTF